MGQVRHGSATTTFAVRAAIQRSQASLAQLSRELGINPKTVAKWRKRETVEDCKTGPKEPRSTVLTDAEDATIVAFRRHTLLPLDDCLYALQPSIPHLTRSALHRCLQRHGISRLPDVAVTNRSGRTSSANPIGFFHIDIAEVQTAEGKLFLFVAIDRTGKFAVAHLPIERAAAEVIVDMEATMLIRQAAVGSTKTMLNRVKQKFDLHPEHPIADTAYATGPMLAWLVDRKIAPHIPMLDNSGRSDGTWTWADFHWDAENDQYICPEDQEQKQFRRNYSDLNRGPSGKGIAKYRCLKHTCQACSSKSRCCPDMDFRSITQEEHEDARQVARNIAKTEQYVIAMKLPKKVEMLFAHLKRILGLNRLRLRGPYGANDEFLLAATAQNLRKLAKILPAPQQRRRA